MKKIAIQFCSLAVLLLFFNSALAQEKQEQGVYVMGHGSLSCGKWLAEKAEPSIRSALSHWLLGYLTGYNSFNTTRQIQLPDMESGIAFLDTYCSNNPLHVMFIGANALIEELGGIKAKHKWKR